MFPASTTDNGIQRGGCDIKFTHHFAYLPILARVAAAYFSNIIFRQLGLMVLNTYRAASSSAVSVLGVIKLSAQNQMGGVHARWNVASMANDQVEIGNWTISKFIRNPMRAWRNATKTDASIAAFITTGRPQPTGVSVGFANVTPKAFKPSGLALSQIISHRSRSMCNHNLLNLYIGNGDSILTRRILI